MANGIVFEFLTETILGWTLLAVLALGVLLLMPLIFQAACSLANVEPPGYFYSLLLVLVTLVFIVPLNGGLVYALVSSHIQEWAGTTAVVVFLLLVGFLLCLVISSLLYIVALRTGIVKGLLAGFYEQLLALLAFALIYGLLFVILSIVQIVWPRLGTKASLAPLAPRVIASVPL